METLVSKKYTHERKVAKIIITKLKRAAATLESDDVNHKNGLKYIISKKVYDDTIEIEFNNKCIAHGSRMIVREFINRSLINAN